MRVFFRAGKIDAMHMSWFDRMEFLLEFVTVTSQSHGFKNDAIPLFY